MFEDFEAEHFEFTSLVNQKFLANTPAPDFIVF